MRTLPRAILLVALGGPQPDQKVAGRPSFFRERASDLRALARQLHFSLRTLPPSTLRITPHGML